MCILLLSMSHIYCTMCKATAKKIENSSTTTTNNKQNQSLTAAISFHQKNLPDKLS
jgi:hypothetical protein